MSVCSIVGPLIGSRLARYGLHIPYAATMVIAAINIAVVYLFMPETLLESERKPFKLKLPNPFEGPLKLLRLKVSHEPKDACGDADEGVVKGRDEGSAGMMTVLLMRVISQLADVRAVNQTQAMYKVHYLRWSSHLDMSYR